MYKVLQYHRRCVPYCNRHKGTILVITAIVLIALIGLLGLVIDAGTLMTAHRRTQNAADSAATAAAMDLSTGASGAAAASSATQFVQEHNGLASAAVTINNPPLVGPRISDSRYVEAIVSYPVSTIFIQILGASSSNYVTARAVAGFEGAGTGNGVMLLDTNARPGFAASGTGSLRVNGTVVINSNGGGLTETGQPINNGNSGSAIGLSGSAKLAALDVLSVGGLMKSGDAAVQQYVVGNPQNPLHTGQPIQPDPLLNLPTPTTANGAVATTYPAVNLSASQSATLSPGVYPSMSFIGSSFATFNPGIYIIKGGGLTFSGNSGAFGTGVMIYLTGSDFNVNTGLPDSADLGQAPPAAGGATFGSLSMSGTGNVQFTPIGAASSPFNGVGFYQRRRSTRPITLSGSSTVGPFRGTIYAKWGTLMLSGNATYNSQFIVRSMAFSGTGTTFVDTSGQNMGGAEQVFLVE